MIHQLTTASVLLPLLGSLVAGLFGKRLGNKLVQYLTIACLLLAFACVLSMLGQVFGHNSSEHWIFYNWVNSGRFDFHFGFMQDRLTLVMSLVVLFVSTLVHVYSIGYMQGDSGFTRFFCYMSLFTFFMMSLVTADNFMQLFFGWEGVGLVSYLLIGFWYKKKDAAEGSLKAFLVNRVGDLGFLLGIAALLDFTGTLDYAPILANLNSLSSTVVNILPHYQVHLLTLVAILFFIGAMGKSAQIPLHVWLPESMAGPTPISALIHAATMVTAGVFMIARLSPLYNLAPYALSFVLIIGATGALFLGLLAIVENDIKRIIAFSTMSQLGYMMAANGAGAYGLAIFHLATHACFKALLFLSAGAVILAMHHEQDINKMGGLRTKLPWVFFCFLAGGLALSAVPPFAGFYSKEIIIEAVHASKLWGAHYAYDCLVIGAFVTSFYTFRLLFKVFFGSNKTDHVIQTPAVMRWPLLLLAIPSVLLGMLLFKSVLGQTNWLGSSIQNRFMHLAPESTTSMLLHSIQSPAFWVSLLGIFVAAVFYLKAPNLPKWIASKFAVFTLLLKSQYGFDAFNDMFWVRGTKSVANWLFSITDVKWIDGVGVLGTGHAMQRLSRLLRKLQGGYLYYYLLVIMLSIIIILFWLLFGN